MSARLRFELNFNGSYSIQLFNTYASIQYLLVSEVKNARILVKNKNSACAGRIPSESESKRKSNINIHIFTGVSHWKHR